MTNETELLPCQSLIAELEKARASNKPLLSSFDEGVVAGLNQAIFIARKHSKQPDVEAVAKVLLDAGFTKAAFQAIMGASPLDLSSGKSTCQVDAPATDTNSQVCKHPPEQCKQTDLWAVVEDGLKAYAKPEQSYDATEGAATKALTAFQQIKEVVERVEIALGACIGGSVGLEQLGNDRLRTDAITALQQLKEKQS